MAIDVFVPDDFSAEMLVHRLSMASAFDDPGPMPVTLAESSLSEMVVSADRRTVFFTSPFTSQLYSYTRGDEGSLTLLEQTSNAQDLGESFSGSAMTISADGQIIFVEDSNRFRSYLVASDGRVTPGPVTQVSDPGLRSGATDPTGSAHLYLPFSGLAGTGGVYHFGLAGALSPASLLNTYGNLVNPTSLALTHSGNCMLVATNFGVVSYVVSDDGSLVEQGTHTAMDMFHVRATGAENLVLVTSLAPGGSSTTLRSLRIDADNCDVLEEIDTQTVDGRAFASQVVAGLGGDFVFLLGTEVQAFGLNPDGTLSMGPSASVGMYPFSLAATEVP